ncbi:MAG: AMP-binding protein [Desulfobacterales bacterium]|nr:AMP-binding protein [Desulfobacterales bacterium]
MTDLDRYRYISFSAPDDIREVQENRLREHLVYCREHSPYYRRTLNNSDMDCESITLEQLSVLPFTEKSDIEQHNDDFCAVSSARIVDIVLSSGTTGRPSRLMYTNDDLQRLAYNEEKSFEGCGITPADMVLLTCTMDRCFVAGLAYFLGIRSLGAAAIRNGLNSLESHRDIIEWMDPTVIVGVPTFLKKLGLYLQGKGMNPAKTAVSRLVCIGEPLRDNDLGLLKIGNDLQNIWQAKAFSTYASSEIVTTFCECTAQQGGHLHPDLAVVEIVDANGRVLPPGIIGEVVVTPMAVEGMPLVRFRTGDMSFLIDTPCSCGRFSPRLGPILGRSKQMMKIRGTTVYPQAVYSVLEELNAVSEYYIVVTSESDLSDSMTIYAAVNDTSCTANIIQDRLQARLRVKSAVVITDEETVKQQVYTPKSRKPVHFIDRR